MLGLMAQAFSLSTGEAEAGGISEFEARLVSMASSGLPGLLGESLFQRQRQRTKKAIQSEGYRTQQIRPRASKMATVLRTALGQSLASISKHLIIHSFLTPIRSRDVGDRKHILQAKKHCSEKSCFLLSFAQLNWQA